MEPQGLEGEFTKGRANAGSLLQLFDADLVKPLRITGCGGVREGDRPASAGFRITEGKPFIRFE